MIRHLLTTSAFAAIVATLGGAGWPPAVALDDNGFPATSLMLADGHGGADDHPERSDHPDHRRPDFAAVADELGVTEDALKTALANSRSANSEPSESAAGRSHPDFALAADELGVTEAALMEALGVSDRIRAREQRISEAAETLGIAEDELKAALGFPTGNFPAFDDNGYLIGELPDRPDFDAAAAELGITRSELMDALGHEGRDRGRDRGNR